MFLVQQPLDYHYKNTCRKVCMLEWTLALHQNIFEYYRLHLVERVGKISLAEVTLTEDPADEAADEGEAAKANIFNIMLHLGFVLESSLYSSTGSFSSLSDISTTSWAGRLDYHRCPWVLSCQLFCLY